jgi:hypothetical protein
MHKPLALRSLLQMNSRSALLALGMAMGLGACADGVGTGGYGTGNIAGQPVGPSRAWTEQIQLHDGSKITAKRTYVLGGRSEPGARESSSTFQTIVFNTSVGDIEWVTDFRDSQPEPNSLSLIAFDIVRGVPYIATRPAGCIAYNKWQRPNPPQVLFKYVNKQWARIGLEEFPKEITQANVVLGRPSTEVLKPFYSVEDVQRENREVKYPEYRSVLREPMTSDQIIANCGDMVPYKGRWVLRNDPVARKWIDREEQEKSKSTAN